MPNYVREPPFNHLNTAKTGLLLINLGTPAAPTAAAVRPYLKEFLSDTRVVEIPRLIWSLILNGIILNIRPKKSAEKYAETKRYFQKLKAKPPRLLDERFAELHDEVFELPQSNPTSLRLQ